MFWGLEKKATGLAVLVVPAIVLSACANPWTKLPDNETTSAIRAKLHRPGKLNHGNYCGFGTVDGTLRYKPVDRLDFACQAHDICYIEGNDHCFCDEWLKRDMAAIIDDPKTDQKLRRKAKLVRSTFSLPVCKAFPQGFMPPRDKKLLESISETEG
ncbi:MAG: hypothetical protein AB3N20_13850 [Rhizobiaceae bacterium]